MPPRADVFSINQCFPKIPPKKVCQKTKNYNGNYFKNKTIKLDLVRKIGGKMNKNKKAAQLSIYLGRGRSIRVEMLKNGESYVTHPQDMDIKEAVSKIRENAYYFTRIAAIEEFFDKDEEEDTMKKEDEDE